MKTRFFLTACVLFILLAAWAGAEPPTAKVIAFVYPPLVNGDGTGLAERFITAAFQERGYTVEFNWYPHKRAMYMFRDSNDSLFISSNVFAESDIVSDIEFEGIAYIRHVLVYMKDRYPSLNIETLEDLKGKTVGCQYGDESIPQFEAAGLLVEEAHLDGNIKKLMAERVDVVSTVDLTALHLIDEIFPGQRSDFGMFELARLLGGVHVKKGSPAEEAFRELRKGLETIRENGIYLKILEEFYGVGQVPASIIVE